MYALNYVAFYLPYKRSANLRIINCIRCRARNITIQKWGIDNLKIKIVTFIVNFGRSNSIRYGQMQIQIGGLNIGGIGLKLISNDFTYTHLYITKKNQQKRFHFKNSRPYIQPTYIELLHFEQDIFFNMMGFVLTALFRKFTSAPPPPPPPMHTLAM